MALPSPGEWTTRTNSVRMAAARSSCWVVPGGSRCFTNSDMGRATGYVPFGVVRDDKGNLYGATSGGGTSNAGILYEITSTGEEKVLYNFAGPPDGQDPGPLVIANGRHYGTAHCGGLASCWV